MVSRKFIEAVKLSDKAAYRIAWEAGVNPVTLRELMNGIIRPKPNDPRVIAVERVLGLVPALCFAPQNQPEPAGVAVERGMS